MINMPDQLPFPYGIRNTESRLIYGNDALVNAYGVKSKKDVIGKLDSEIKSVVLAHDDFLEEFDKQYKKAHQSEVGFSTLEIHPLAFDYPYIFHKKPYYNDNNECVGMFGYNIKMEVYSLND